MKRSDTTKAVERFLAARGIAYRTDWTRRHPRIEVPRPGRNVFVSFSLTTRNRNSAYDMVTRLRRALGLVGQQR
jgi:hypothetical protein